MAKYSAWNGEGPQQPEEKKKKKIKDGTTDAGMKLERVPGLPVLNKGTSTLGSMDVIPLWFLLMMHDTLQSGLPSSR